MNWTCDDTRRRLSSAGEWSDAALEHLTACAVCREMADSVSAVEQQGESRPALEPLVLSKLLTRTERAIADERGLLAWLRSRSSAQRRLFGFCVALAPALAQLALARRCDLGSYPFPRLLLVFGLYAGALVLAERTILFPLHRPLRTRQRAAVTVLALALPFVVAASAPAYVDADALSTAAQGPFLYQAWICMRYGAMLSLPAIVLVLAMDRQPGRSRGLATALAGLGALIGNLTLLLHCPNEDPAHQWLGHAAIGLLLLLVLLPVFGLVRIWHRRSSAARHEASR